MDERRQFTVGDLIDRLDELWFVEDVVWKEQSKHYWVEAEEIEAKKEDSRRTLAKRLAELSAIADVARKQQRRRDQELYNAVMGQYWHQGWTWAEEDEARAENDRTKERVANAILRLQRVDISGGKAPTYSGVSLTNYPKDALIRMIGEMLVHPSDWIR